MELERVDSIAEAQSKIRAAEEDRIVYWYDVPEKISRTTHVNRIGLVELSAGEELMATRRARNDAIQLAFELAKESVRWVNDDKVNTGNGTADAFWGQKLQGMAPLRALILAAYQEIHAPGADDIQAFIQSRRARAR